MTEVPMPKLSMNMSEGEIIEWLVEDGDEVEENQPICEIESEKTSSTVEAPTSGTISIEVGAGQSVQAGAIVATIGSTDESQAGSTTETDTEGQTASNTTDPATESEGAPSRREPPREAQSTVRATPTARWSARERGVDISTVAESLDKNRIDQDDVTVYATQAGDPAAATESTGQTRSSQPESLRHADRARAGDGVRASPAARQKARDREVELHRINGSGPDGAVILADVEAVESDIATSTPAQSPTDEPSPRGSVRKRQELSGVRGVIADRLSRSWREAPHVTVNRDISVEGLRQVKEELMTDLDVPVSLNDLFLSAVSETLKDHPEFNATLEGGEHVQYENIDIAIAVDTDRGLLSPVLREVGDKSFIEIATSRADLVTAALEDEVPPHQLEGGTFTVTNLGMLGVSSFTPIINPPQVGILGISAIQEKPRRTRKGDIVFEEMMTASLSFDHRAVDGADAAKFLETFDEYLSRPLALIVR